MVFFAEVLIFLYFRGQSIGQKWGEGEALPPATALVSPI